ncbi:protein artemis-like isoform X2 [Ostrea edulis]|uniref:protein artemis-like isoform X2 n=1 Tax=Ostrea edulis TaxID=37623 RepID=UPI002095599F|nr:protein artemis-like isoform X2 [Ostrea edulis]
MSCFNGRMREYRRVSLDRFDGPNLRSTVFFLSHCHCDHMEGLAAVEFFERLSSRNDIFLYCSEITKILLMEKHPKLEKFVRTLKVGQPSVIPIPQQESAKTEEVTVTLIHASHCPGSVIVKPLVSLYVDTTFCHPNSFYIPSRHTIIRAVCDLVKEWTSKGDKHVIHFTPRANYGHEPLLKEVAQSLGCKVHVKKDKEDIYNQMSELRGIFTSDAGATPIHACGGRVYGKVPCLPCDLRNKNLKVMVILPSTMFFTQSVHLSEGEVMLWDRGMYRVCYSFHSSMLEVRDLVTYLQPRQVFPNVKPAEDTTLAQVQRRLNEFLRLKHSSRVREELDSQRPLGLLKQAVKNRKRQISEMSSDSEELMFGSQNFHSSKKLCKFTTLPSKNDITEKTEDDDDYQSSYGGSCHSDSEISGICESDEEKEENSQTLSTPRQSLLDAIHSQIDSQSECLSHRIVVYDDCEQTEGKSVSLEELEKQHLQEVDEENADLENVPDEHAYQNGFHGSSCNSRISTELPINNGEIDESPKPDTHTSQGTAHSTESKYRRGNTSTESLESQTKCFSGSNDLFDEKCDSPCDDDRDVCDLHVTPSDCDSPIDPLSHTQDLNQESKKGTVCDIQESQGFVMGKIKNDGRELSCVSEHEDLDIKILSVEMGNPVIVITDESLSAGEDCPLRNDSLSAGKDRPSRNDSLSAGEDRPSRNSSQQSKISINDKEEKKLHKDSCKENRVFPKNNGGFVDEIEALFEVEDSDDDVEVVEDTKSKTMAPETRTSFQGVPGSSASLCEESDSDATLPPSQNSYSESPHKHMKLTADDSDSTLPPSQNSYSESPHKHRKSTADDSVEIVEKESETRTEINPHCSNTTPRKLRQSTIDFFVSPSKDSPEKFSPSIVKRRKKSSDWLNTRYRNLVYVSEEEDCNGSDKVVDLTLSSDEES